MPLTDSLFIAPGNGGTDSYGTNVAIKPTDFEAIDKFVTDNAIDMIVVGNEDPLVAGIYSKYSNTPAFCVSALILSHCGGKCKGYLYLERKKEDTGKPASVLCAWLRGGRLFR